MDWATIYAEARTAEGEGDFSRAARLHEAVAQVYLAQADFDRASAVLVSAARCYLERGLDEDAERAASEAVLVSHSASMPRVQGLAHEVSIECAYQRHDFLSAETRLRSRLALSSGLSRSPELLQCWMRLANTLQWQGRFDDAIRAGAEAASLVAADPRRQEAYARVLSVLEDWHWRHAWAREAVPATFAMLDVGDRRALSLWHDGRRLVLYRAHPGFYSTDSALEIEANRDLWRAVGASLGVDASRIAVGFRVHRGSEVTDNGARVTAWCLEGEYPPSRTPYTSFLLEVLEHENAWNEGIARISLASS